MAYLPVEFAEGFTYPCFPLLPCLTNRLRILQISGNGKEARTSGNLAPITYSFETVFREK
jgi:hypothetical protein